MSDKRIDITELEKRFQDGLNWDDTDTMDLIAELKRCYEELGEVEYRLEMAEDVLGRSDWNSVYRELIAPPE